MKEPTYIRKDHLILTASGALFKDCGSINAAKKMSRSLQKGGEVVRAEQTKRPGPKIKEKRRGYKSPPPKQQNKDKPRLLGLSQAEVRRLQANTDD